MCGFKQQRFVVSQFWRLQVPSQGVGRAVFPLELVWKSVPWPLSVLCLPASLGIPWRVDAPLGLKRHLCVLIRTLVILDWGPL